MPMLSTVISSVWSLIRNSKTFSKLKESQSPSFQILLLGGLLIPIGLSHELYLSLYLLTTGSLYFSPLENPQPFTLHRISHAWCQRLKAFKCKETCRISTNTAWR
jgi:hypothetical protein